MRIGSATFYPQQPPQRPVDSLSEGTLLAIGLGPLPQVSPPSPPAPPPPSKGELWDKDNFLEKGRPDEIAPPAIRNNFASAEEIDDYLAESKIRIHVTLAGKTVGDVLTVVQKFSQEDAKSLVATIKGAPQFPKQPIKDPGKKSKAILKSVKDFVALNFKGHAEKNYYLRILVLDQKRVVDLTNHLDFSISVPPEAGKVLIDRIREIENILYASYQNIVQRLMEAEPTGPASEEELAEAYLTLVTGETDPDKAFDKFLKGPGRYIKFADGEQENRKDPRVIRAAKELIGSRWFKSAPTLVVAKAPPPPTKPPAESTPPPAAPAPPTPVPVPAPTVPTPTLPALAKRAAKPIAPSLFTLTPQKGGQELLSTPCSGRRTSEDKDDFVLEEGRCSVGGQTISVSIRSDFDAKSSNWTPWKYQIDGKITQGTAQDTGLLIYTSGSGLETFPYQSNKEQEAKLAGLLFPQYHFPHGIALSYLDYSDQREKVRKSSCALEKDVKTFSKDADHLEGIGNEYLCKSYFVHDKPSLMAPFLSQPQGDATLYRLGNWLLTRPSGDGVEIQDNRQVAFPKEHTESPFLFTDDTDLLRQLTERVFLKPPAIEAMASRYGEDYGRVYSRPSGCHLENMVTDEKTKMQTVEGQCQFRPGESTSLKLTRRFDIQPSGDETLFSVSDWSLDIKGRDQTISANVDPDNRITLIPAAEQGVDILQYETEEERTRLLDERYQSTVSDRYFPKVLVLRGALSYVNSDFASLNPPSLGERHSEGAGSFHNTAITNSEPDNSSSQGRGALLGLQSEVYLGSLVGASIGGPFIAGQVAAGQAGRYNDKPLYIAEADLGLGVALREIFGWETPFDLSLRWMFLRRTFYSSEETLVSTARFSSPFFGGCLTLSRTNLCLDYTRDSDASQNLQMLRLSLGYDFFKIENHPHVEIGR